MPTESQQNARVRSHYLFIDECGDPNFYGKRRKFLVGTEGFQPLLLVGLVATEDRRKLRQDVLDFRAQILSDPLYNSIFSIRTNPKWLPHGRADHPDVRAKFFEKLRTLEGFKTYVVIARKKVDLFQRKHNSSASEFYFDVLYHLMKDRLNDPEVDYSIYLSHRDKKSTHRFTAAIQQAIERDNSRRKDPMQIRYRCDMAPSSQFPEMSVVDYLLWALQRYILKQEERFFKSVIDKYNLIIDLYDRNNYINGRNYYTRDYPFDLGKASSFEL